MNEPERLKRLTKVLTQMHCLEKAKLSLATAETVECQLQQQELLSALASDYIFDIRHQRALSTRMNRLTNQIQRLERQIEVQRDIYLKAGAKQKLAITKLQASMRDAERVDDDNKIAEAIEYILLQKR